MACRGKFPGGDNLSHWRAGRRKVKRLGDRDDGSSGKREIHLFLREGLGLAGSRDNGEMLD